MISRFWWLNFLLIILISLLSVIIINIWFGRTDIAQSDTIRSRKEWPDPGHITRTLFNEADTSLIEEKNIFSSTRKPVPKVAVPPLKKTTPVKGKNLPPAPKKEPEVIKKLEPQKITLFGVLLFEDTKYAFVSNPDKSSVKRQVRRSEKDMIGEYLLDRILPDKILVSARGKRFEVPILKKKTPEQSPKKGKKTVKTAPRILSTSSGDDSPARTALRALSANSDNDDSPGTEVKSMDNKDYIIVKTPFGKIKRRIKKQ